MKTSMTPRAESDALPRIHVTEQDWQRLNSLLTTARRRGSLAEDEALDAELARAEVVPSSEIGPDVVTMNSRVRFALGDGRCYVRTLVYPWDADAEKGLVSVLAPLGNALLGLSVDDVMTWTLPDGRTVKVKVLEVLYQPEAAGDPHL
ncbi:MAG: nucleoside diphosphate kinase regulator [Polyangiales bacterium]